jgi:IS30 family transposase
MKYRDEILKAGLKLWHYDPSKVSTRNIAKIIGKSHVTVFNEFPNGVKNAVAAYGVRQKDSVVIVSLILSKSKLVAHLTDEELEHHWNAVKTF